jgi:hypothetical protein
MVLQKKRKMMTCCRGETEELGVGRSRNGQKHNISEVLHRVLYPKAHKNGLEKKKGDVSFMGHDEANEALEFLRADALEPAFAIKWLIGFTAQSDTWVTPYPKKRRHT